jgi:hypothetical protein
MNLFGKIDQLKAAREGKSLSGEWIRGAVTGKKTDVSRSETVSAVWRSMMT